VLDELAARNEPTLGEVQVRRTRDPINAVDIYGWHKPSVRALVKRLERTYGIRASSMTSYTIPSFTAYVPTAVLAALREDPAFDRAHAVFTDDSYFSSWWTDTSSGSETIPWGKAAIGTNDGLSTSNRIYMLDGAVPFPAAHVDLSFNRAPVNTSFTAAADHASHVMGILSAAANNTAVRGVNPGASDVVAVYFGSSSGDTITAMDWVLADAEQDGIYGVVNVSVNGTAWAQYFGGMYLPVMRRMSTRVLVVQAAGNNHQDACNEAYGPANNRDGILVVGGIDNDGYEALSYDNRGAWGLGYPILLGSNFGPCVEVWAPSKNIQSTWNTSSTAVMTLSGTSMAAPHVTSLAARYGSNTTTPVERETWIRAKLFVTGQLSGSAQAIVVPSYTAVLSMIPGTRLLPSSASADATAAGTSVNFLSDSLYLSTNVWNAGHFAPAWVEFDLGATKTITGIRAVPEQFPSGSVSHTIYAGNSPAPSTPVGTLSSSSGNVLEPLSTAISASARYIRIYTSTSPSHVAWREIEIYGY